MEKGKWGGRRAGAGAKRIDDKKKTVAIYPRQSRIDAMGIEAVKGIALTAIEKEFKKINKKDEIIFGESK